MKKNKNFLISGTSSGLGNYLSYKFNSDKFDRKKNLNFYINDHYKTIIHCAFNKKISINGINTLDLLNDNIFLVQNLINIPHDKFILISSVDIYEKNNKTHKENEKIKIKSDTSFYSVAKIIQEEIVKKNCEKYLILRPSSLLGRGMKKNTIVKILNSIDRKKFGKINLEGDSTLNFILYEDVYKVIKNEIPKKNNVLNLVSKKNLKINEIIKEFNSKIKTGEYKHKTPKVSNKKIIANYKFLDKSSIDNLKYFYKKNYEK